jgi:hypothetical protein
MFALSHEVPLAMLEESRKFNDYDYALVHLFEQSKTYYEFYAESLEKGRQVILDNSAYELGTPFDIEKYKAYIQTLRPSEFILPDYRDDYPMTMEAIKNWNLKSNSIRIGVAHGKTYLEFVDCYIEMQPYVDKIAISVDSFFFEGCTDPTEARIKVIARMVADGVINEDIPHHILGALSPTEYKSFIQYEWIESVDTSNPVLHGLLGIMYEGEEGLKEKSPVKMDSIMFNIFSEERLDTARYNVAKFRADLYKTNFTPKREVAVKKLQEPDPEDTCPERYASRKVHGMDVIDLVKHWGLNFNEGSILKYLLRDKGEDISDMGKIIVFAQRELKYLEED